MLFLVRKKKYTGNVQMVTPGNHPSLPAPGTTSYGVRILSSVRNRCLVFLLTLRTMPPNLSRRSAEYGVWLVQIFGTPLHCDLGIFHGKSAFFSLMEIAPVPAKADVPSVILESYSDGPLHNLWILLLLSFGIPQNTPFFQNVQSPDPVSEDRFSSRPIVQPGRDGSLPLLCQSF